MPDIVDNTSTTASLTLGSSLADFLETPTDSDWVRVQLTAGQTYSFSMAGNGLDDAADTLLILRDASGTEIARNDNFVTTYSRFSFTATASGTYYLDARAANDAPANAGGYLLSMNPIVAVAGAPNGLPLFTLDQIANRLTNGWGGGGEARAFNVGADGSLTINLTGLAADGQALARAAFAVWSDVTGIAFVETAGAAEITLNDNEAGDQAYATSVRSGTTITSSNIQVSQGWITTNGTTLDSYSFQTYIHEIGHALGLDHPGDYNGNAAFPADAFFANDSVTTTIMSYFFQSVNTTITASDGIIVTPQIADIIAIQNLYGAANNTRLGDTTYGFNSNAGNVIFAANALAGPISFTVYDSGGTDTLDFSGYAQQQRINLAGGTLSDVGGRTLNVGIARNTVIENAIGGSAADVILGNEAINRLDGNDGFDTLAGLGGSDTLNGGSGTDVLNGGAGADVLNGGSESDYAFYGNSAAGVTVDLLLNTGTGGEAQGDTFSSVEGIIGSIFADTLRGDNLANTLVGGGGDDLLDGGAAGDVLVGGANTAAGDTVTYANATGTVNVNLNNGVGRGVEAAGDQLVGIENLVGSSFGDLLRGDGNANRIEGAGSGDFLLGEGGADTIVGGAGGDFLTGGAGDDTFVFRPGANTDADIIVDFDQNGNDVIRMEGFGAGFDFSNISLVTVNTTGVAVYANGDTLVAVLRGAVGQVAADDFVFA